MNVPEFLRLQLKIGCIYGASTEMERTCLGRPWKVSVKKVNNGLVL